MKNKYSEERRPLPERGQRTKTNRRRRPGPAKK